MTGPLRVLFAIPGEPHGSSMIFALRQAASLVREGVEVRTFHIRSRTSPGILIREFFRFRSEMRSFGPHVIHAQFGTMTALFASAACGFRPLVITYRGTDLNPDPGLRAALGRLMSQLAALRASGIVCVSPELRRRLWWRRKRAVILPTGVDRELFQPRDRDSARQRLHWPEDAPVVLFNAGFNRRIKRIDLAERAVAVARDTLPGLRLEILNGEVDPALIPELMNASDCLLITSDREGSPTVVQEALSCGLPIVSVRVADVPERVSGVSNTRVVERDAAELGRALVELTARPLRTDGPAKAADFSSERIAHRLKEMYLAVAGSGVPPCNTSHS